LDSQHFVCLRRCLHCDVSDPVNLCHAAVEPYHYLLINNYVNDLLCLPLLLGDDLCNRLLKDNSFTFSIGLLSFGLLLFFYFEYYLPEVNPRYTADWIDVILYFSGGFIFFFSENEKNKTVAIGF
jgi:hypothetical protein